MLMLIHIHFLLLYDINHYYYYYSFFIIIYDKSLL